MLRLLVCAFVVLPLCYGQEDLSAIEQGLANAEEMIVKYEKRLNEQNKIIKEQQFVIESLVKKHKERQEAASAIAFTAVADDQTEYYEGDTIQFPTTITNYGYDYDESTSVFTCPVSGIYLFSVTLYTELDNWISADIVKTAIPLVRVWSPDTLQDDQATHKVTATCFIGEQVWVRCVEDGILEGRINDNAAVTTFSGILIERI